MNSRIVKSGSISSNGCMWVSSIYYWTIRKVWSRPWSSRKLAWVRSRESRWMQPSFGRVGQFKWSKRWVRLDQRMWQWSRRKPHWSSGTWPRRPRSATQGPMPSSTNKAWVIPWRLLITSSVWANCLYFSKTTMTPKLSSLLLFVLNTPYCSHKIHSYWKPKKTSKLFLKRMESL